MRQAQPLSPVGSQPTRLARATRLVPPQGLARATRLVLPQGPARAMRLVLSPLRSAFPLRLARAPRRIPSGRQAPPAKANQ
jgi:hypothetical protein